MKLTRSWLEEFVTIPYGDPADLVETFENLGHEVEQWRILEPEFTGVVVGKVLEVASHPNADKVRLTKVDVGSEVLDIICGAWNFEAGAIVPVAVPGAVLGGDFTITRREIRGVVSNGMICSESELGLGEDAAGIMVLNDDYPNAAQQVGEDFAAVVGFPDQWFEINVTPNRPDCLSVYGLARDLAAYFEVPLRDPNIHVDGDGAPSTVTVGIDVPEMCPRFAGRQVRGITVGTSPHWLRWRLEQAGVRPISNVVDASNYAMIEFGHPTHAFDVDRLGRTISVRMASDGEQIVTLDDQTRTLTTDDIVVTDGEAPVAIGGVMGGASTEVHEDTTDVFIEAAYWDPAHVLMTSKRLNLRSEASARFERGADPSFCHLGADRVAQLLVDIAGGTPAPDAVDVDPGGIAPWTIAYPLSETTRILGVVIDAATTASYLERLGFGVEGDGPLTVTVPTRRPDVRRRVDLVEEIARLHGFASIPDTVPSGPGHGLPDTERKLRRLREALVGAGLYEILSFSFIGAADIDMLGHGPAETSTAIPVVNPLNDTEGVMRTTLVPGLLKAASTNLARRLPGAALFEIGKVFLTGTGKLPEQPDRIGVVLAGEREPTWDAPARSYDVHDGTGIVDLLASELRVPDVRFVPGAAPAFHPGRCGEVHIGDTVIGTVGEILPSVAEAFGLTGRVVVVEMDVAPFLVDRGHWTYRPPSTFPPVVFDLAFAADVDVPVHEIMSAAQAAAGSMLEHCGLFDVFRGDSVGEGKVSYALSFRLRAPDRTLTDADVAPIRRAIAEAVTERTGATLRGEL